MERPFAFQETKLPMKPFHHLTVFFISEEEKADFLKTGVKFKEVTQGPRGEAAIFEIGEDDPRWERVAALVASLEGNEHVPKSFRVQDIPMTKPTLAETMADSIRRVRIGGPGWLEGYSGQTVDELLSLEGKYRIDSLVLAFEEAIGRKRKRDASQVLTGVERIVLAVEALEREVNNGGYDQFFTNSSLEFASTVVESLQRIGCERTAKLTQKAIRALGVSNPTEEAIEAVMATEDKLRRAKLRLCDVVYYGKAEPIAERLFAFIKDHAAEIRL
jgi:hypothetical protein